MSQHHRAQKWTSRAPGLRKLHEAQLPRPCVECGQLVTRTDKWQVGHRRDAMDGGAATFANTGPVHSKSPTWPRNCNQIAGGKRGAAVTNASKVAARRGPDIRAW